MKTRHIECRPAELKYGDVLPYIKRNAAVVMADRMTGSMAGMILVSFNDGSAIRMERSMLLTALREVAK